MTGATCLLAAVLFGAAVAGVVEPLAGAGAALSLLGGTTCTTRGGVTGVAEGHVDTSVLLFGAAVAGAGELVAGAGAVPSLLGGTACTTRCGATVVVGVGRVDTSGRRVIGGVVAGVAVQ
jgi:hypothetical protein